MLLTFRAVLTAAVLATANSTVTFRAAAFIPTHGLLCRSWSSVGRKTQSPTMPISSKPPRLRRRQSAVQVESLNDENESTILSTDEESLLDLEHGKPEEAIPNNTPMLWGAPLQSILLLNLVAIIWGTQHAVIKSAVDNISFGADTTIKEWVFKLLGTQNAVSAGLLNDGDTAAYLHRRNLDWPLCLRVLTHPV